MFQGGDFALQAMCVGFDSLALHQIAAVAEWIRREFPKLVNAGSIPAGSLRARVAQRKSDTRGEGHMRVQISSRAPVIGDGGWKTGDRDGGLKGRTGQLKCK